MTGLNKRDIIQLFTFKALTRAPQHSAHIYQSFIESVAAKPGKEHSRAYIYSAIKNMEEKGWIVGQVDGKKIFYQITLDGNTYYNTCVKNYKQSLLNTKQIIDNILEDIINTGYQKKNVTLDEKTKQFVSKLFNIREVIEYFILKTLMENSAYGGMLHQSMSKKYNWQASHGYFYSILREMDIGDVAGWVQSYWDSDISRGKRIYVITPNGELAYKTLAEKITLQLRQVRNYVNELLPLF